MSERVRRFLKLAIFATALVLVLLVCILPIGGAFLYVHLMLNRDCVGQVPLSERLTDTTGLEAFTFESEDGIVLDAWFQPGTNGAGIVILPGAYGNADSMDLEFKFLHEAGYNVMTYDTRTCANPPHRASLGYREVADLKAAIDWMEQRPDVDQDRIGVLGYSMGGATAIMTAAEDERIKALVASGNYGDLATDIRRDNRQRGILERWVRGWIERFYEWETDVDLDEVRPLAVIGEISPRAVFLIHGSHEFNSNRAEQQFANAGEPKELWIVEGVGHGGYYGAAPEEYPRRIIAFFDTYLGENND